MRFILNFCMFWQKIDLELFLDLFNLARKINYMIPFPFQ